jgi:hypothetical protein
MRGLRAPYRFHECEKLMSSPSPNWNPNAVGRPILVDVDGGKFATISSLHKEMNWYKVALSSDDPTEAVEYLVHEVHVLKYLDVADFESVESLELAPEA